VYKLHFSPYFNLKNGKSWFHSKYIISKTIMGPYIFRFSEKTFDKCKQVLVLCTTHGVYLSANFICSRGSVCIFVVSQYNGFMNYSPGKTRKCANIAEHRTTRSRGGSSILCELLPFQNNPTVSIDRRRREKLGGSGGIPPRKILKIGLSEMPFSAL